MSLSKVETVKLPYTISSLDEDDIFMGVDRNFKEVEYYLAQIQSYMNSEGFGSITNSNSFLNNAITYGLDASKPVLTGG